jgi:hypothetical protein
MTPLLLTLATFVAFFVVGMATLAVVRADTGNLRVALTAPALGSAVMLLPAFLFSEAGVAIEDVAVPLIVVVVLTATCILAYRRPRVPAGVLPVLVVCVGGLLLAARPMFEFGFNWIANANDDMANYTLSAQQLLHHGLLAALDIKGILRGTDYATSLTSLHLAGARPGTDLLLAVLAGTTHRLPYEVFMPLVFAFNLCGVCSVGALAMQATDRKWAATVAAALLAVSPLATFGVLQQLIAQVWGLALGAALFALLMRPELHRKRARRIADGVPIAVLVTALLIGYIELASVLTVAYAAYLLVLGLRKELSLRVIGGVWLVAAVAVVVVLNAYALKELHFVQGQANIGGSGGKEVPLFGFSLVPTALPGLLGIQELRPLIEAPHIPLSIGVAGILLIGAFVGCLVSARRGVGAAVVLVVFTVLAAVLALKSSDFGLYKLFMYVQPFLAAAVAVWIASTRGVLRWALATAVALVVIAQISTQSAYVARSREPIELPHASASDVLPAFRHLAARARGPIVAESENPTLSKLEAESERGRPIFFLGTNAFFQTLLATPLQGEERAKEIRASHSYAAQRSFNLLGSVSQHSDHFNEVIPASSALADQSCELAFPTGTEVVINRRSLPEGLPGIVGVSCGTARNLLAFVSSELGESYYLPAHRPNVSFYQLEGDYFFPGESLAGFGRYALFRVVGPTPNGRLELNLTTSLRHNGSNLIPPAAAVGATRTPLPVVGRGSARVFSAPLRYQTIAGAPYLLLDLGANGQLATYVRSGLAGLYSRSVVIDPRFLAAYVRNVSLIGEAEYDQLRPPQALQRFPADLGNNDLEYSGIYEDGWVGENSYVVLGGGPRAELELRAAVPEGAGKHLELLLDRRVIASVPVPAGALSVSVPVPASSSRRRVELRFAATVHLKAPDLRPASALLSFLGFVAPARGG